MVLDAPEWWVGIEKGLAVENDELQDNEDLWGEGKVAYRMLGQVRLGNYQAVSRC